MKPDQPANAPSDSIARCCPFCAADPAKTFDPSGGTSPLGEVPTIQVHRNTFGGKFVGCNICGCRGPSRFKREDAITAWHVDSLAQRRASFPSAEDELKTTTRRFWDQVEVTEKLLDENERLKATTVEKIGMGTKPDPCKYTIEEIEEYSKGCIIQANYGGATFGGSKLMILSGLTRKDVLARTTLDPHFFEDHPIVARFIPTEYGWSLARLLVNNL